MVFVYAPVTLYGSTFQRIRLTTRLVTLLLRTLQPPLHRNGTGLGYSDFARHYSRNRGFFLFLQVLRWFTSLSSLIPAYVFSGMYYGFAIVGFPIRKSPDITPVCGSPKLIAACHVLHRLILPRHPPCALSSLTIELTLAQQSDLHLRYRGRELIELVSFIFACVWIASLAGCDVHSLIILKTLN
jgi:hypothetical protein